MPLTTMFAFKFNIETDDDRIFGGKRFLKKKIQIVFFFQILVCQ